jgi:hypothetical protein
VTRRKVPESADYEVNGGEWSLVERFDTLGVLGEYLNEEGCSNIPQRNVKSNIALLHLILLCGLFHQI